MTGSSNLAVSDAAVALMFGASAGTQRLAVGRGEPAARICGIALSLIGFGLLIGAGVAGSLPLLLAATVTAGIGQGLVFLAALSLINRISPVDSRADILSSFFAVTYMGKGLPVIGVGILASRIGLLAAVEYFSTAAAAGCVILLATHVLRLIRGR